MTITIYYGEIAWLKPPTYNIYLQLGDQKLVGSDRCVKHHIRPSSPAAILGYSKSVKNIGESSITSVCFGFGKYIISYLCQHIKA